MAQKCDITGKGKQFGHNVPFSQKKTKKVWKPNLQKKTFVMDGKKVTMKLSTTAIRTLKKKGVL
jgi:large subunit ribosomal protein L28